MKKILYIILGVLILGGGVALVIWLTSGIPERQNINQNQPTGIALNLSQEPPATLEASLGSKIGTDRVDLFGVHPTFRFFAELPETWKVEYREDTDALNLYNPESSGSSTLDQSQIFIRKFEANTFLTLSTVTIHEREETTVGRHSAVRYQITKKENVGDFPGQPVWRNQTHRLVDIRYEEKNPSIFYVVAYHPDLTSEVIDAIVESFEFHNDRESFEWPIDRPEQRVTKKPFGLLIDPTTSPVQPENFSGYHTGTDFEVFEAEQTQEVQIRTLCGGKLQSKQSAQGYGGVIVQACELDEQPITVIYGHLDLTSAQSEVGTYLAPGVLLGNLGDEYSEETDNERKHLHLGVHRGSTLELRGYVQHQNELQDWMNVESEILSFF